MKRFGVIYLATNLLTGEQYVGQTCESLRRRANNHKASIGAYKTKFALAMAQHGFHNFTFEEVFTAFTEEALHEAEKSIIASVKPTYNMTHGGSGLRGYTPSKETIAKQKATMRARLQDPAIRAKWSQAQIGRKHPKEEVFKTAKAKWKPVFCKELAVSFLNQKYAAEYFGVRPSTVVESMKRKGKVANKFTLIRVV